jgi:hypothetical protein
MISTILKHQIEDYADELRRSSPLLARARAGTLSLSSVGKYFASIHYLLTQTPVHLEIARSRATDVGAVELARFFDAKQCEEAGHEDWAAADVERLRTAFGSVAWTEQPAAAMIELVAHTRERISSDPYSYLAYILFAEYFTVVLGPEWLAALQHNCGVPGDAMTSVSKHIDLDKEHVLEGCRELELLAGEEAHHASLRSMLEATMSRFSAFCTELEAA